MRKTLVAVLFGALFPVIAAAKTMYVPAAAFTQGNAGTFWRTDLRIYNPSAEDSLSITLHFLPRGIDGTNIPGQVFTVPKRGTLVLNNVVGTLAPFVVSGVGAIRLDSDTDRGYPFVASSRTYTTSGSVTRPGTYGQYVPALAPSDARATTALLQVTERPEFRTNAGVMNPGDAAVTLKFKLMATDGVTVLESSEQTVLPKSMNQWSLMELFGAVYVADATIVVEASAPVFTWASVVDNASGDAIFVSGVEHDTTIGPIGN